MASFIIKQGSDGGIVWPVMNKGVLADLTLWSGVVQIRAYNSNRLIHTFDTNKGNLILGVGKVTLTWTAADTAAWKWKQAKYGIELTTPEGKLVRLKQGVVILSSEVVK